MDEFGYLSGTASKEESEHRGKLRWVASLYPPTSFDASQAMVASANPLLADKTVRDPTLFCTGYKRQRFYMFTRSEPE